MMIIRAMAAAFAATMFGFPVYAQTMPNQLNTLANAAATVSGDPLPRAKPETVGMSSERLGEIAKVINGDVEKGRIPGAVVAIARKGKLVYFESFGFRDKAARGAMTNHTLFHIASMSQPMGAPPALQLHAPR